ncbi:MAG TPA: FadR/GntR family transcriptional regulator [Stellaceae bacterium]|nr:FadR/GntR family transcriptional regulator [Stellaceae bacterium]
MATATPTKRTYSRQNLHGKVAHTLSESIVRGELAPGSLLPSEAELSRRLGVSRTALREGIKLMAAKGLLESRRKTGTRVRPRDEWNLLDPDVLAWQMAATSVDFAGHLFELRLMVEPAAAALAAQRHGAADIAALTQIVEGLAISRGIPAWIDLDIRFHRTLFGAARNDCIGAMATLAEASLPLLGRIRALPPRARVDALAQRRAILAAVVARDGARAEAVMREAITWSRDTLLGQLAHDASEGGTPANPVLSDTDSGIAGDDAHPARRSFNDMVVVPFRR